MVLFFAVFVGSSYTIGASDRPNVVIVLCDDLGYGDLACYGNAVVQTPNIDAFASGGMRLTQCYAAAPNCSPSRTGLMTGRTPYRVGIHNWIPYDSPMHVAAKEITVAKLLRQAGYSTCHVGKWHLNGNLTDTRYPQPKDHGFQWSFGTQNNAIPTHKDPDNFVRNGEPVGPLEGFAADLVTNEAISWLSNTYDGTSPFFLYVAYHEPHEPIHTSRQYVDMYPASGKPSRYDPQTTTSQAFFGNITQMDTAFGRLIGHLRATGLDENTLILFTSDNGPAITGTHPHGSTGGFRAKKGYLYEGGIRVPGIIQYKGITQPGTVCDTPVSGVDILPTLCRLAGVRLPRSPVLDGTDVSSVFKGRPMVRRKPLYWQFHPTRGEHQVALREGNWKLVASIEGGGMPLFGDIRQEDQFAIKNAILADFALYDLTNGQEMTDLSGENYRQFRRMERMLRHRFSAVLEESPVWPNWKWPQWEGKRINKFVEDLNQDG